MRKTLRGVALAGLLLAAITSWPAVAQKHQQNKIALPPIGTQGRLHQLAQKSGGHFVLRYRPNNSTLYPNLEELAKRSDLIVIGRTLGHRTTLRGDGNFITQDFRVKVQEVIKGDLSLEKSRSITVTLPGGSYMFPDKTFVTVSTMGQQPAADKETYVFFLRAPKKGSALTSHLLASETQGMYALKEGKVAPSDQAGAHPLAQKYRNMGAADFLRQVHQVVPRTTKAQGIGK